MRTLAFPYHRQNDVRRCAGRSLWSRGLIDHDNLIHVEDWQLSGQSALPWRWRAQVTGRCRWPLRTRLWRRYGAADWCWCRWIICSPADETGVQLNMCCTSAWAHWTLSATLLKLAMQRYLTAPCSWCRCLLGVPGLLSNTPIELSLPIRHLLCARKPLSFLCLIPHLLKAAPCRPFWNFAELTVSPQRQRSTR